jgi:hypothetical protein
MGQLYEVVSGQILLSRRQEFFRLHREFLLPAMEQIGIVPCHLLLTEVGEYGRFLDIYAYADFADYEHKTEQLLSAEGMEEYYQEIGQCIQGSITVSLMRDLPYAKAFIEQ